MNKKTTLMGATALFALGAGAAFAADATAITDLNLRMGPGPAYQIAAVIPAQGTVDVRGCVADGAWCEVTFEEQTGWAYGAYLLQDETPVIEVPETAVIQYETTDDAEGAAMIGTATGVTIGALVGGPIGAVVGGIIGAGAGGEAAKLNEETTIYIRENPVDPVFLDGEVVVGAQVQSDTVTYYEIPSNERYAYTNINGNTVLVDPENHTIVEILR